MAIAYLGEQHFGSADDANVTTNPLILDKDVAPFSTLSIGDVVVVVVGWRNASTSSNTVTGGQTWTEDLDHSTNAQVAVYTCVFNGTWIADPEFATAAPTPLGGIGWAVAHSGVDQTTPWDVAPVSTAQAASTTFVEDDYNTNTDGALAFAGAATLDNNTWSVDNGFAAPSGSGNIYWRNSASADESLVLCTKAIPTAGSVGATTMTQVTLGADAGMRWHGALKPAAGGATNLVIADAAHTHAADELALTQVHELVINEAGHGHVADALTLTQVHDLAVQEALHAHAADNVVLDAGDPLKVQNLVATGVSGSQVDLTWDDVTELTGEGYDIERDDVIIVWFHGTNSYSNTGLDPSTTYTYRVRASETV